MGFVKLAVALGVVAFVVAAFALSNRADFTSECAPDELGESHRTAAECYLAECDEGDRHACEASIAHRLADR